MVKTLQNMFCKDIILVKNISSKLYFTVLTLYLDNMTNIKLSKVKSHRKYLQ